MNGMIRLSPTPASSDSGESSAALLVRVLQHLTKNKQFVCQGLKVQYQEIGLDPKNEFLMEQQ